MIPLVIPLLDHGYPFAHDRSKPYAYVIAIEDALRDGQFPPRWFVEFDGGYGSPYPSFYAMLFYWIALLFHIMGIPVGAALECAIVVVLVSSGISMFLFVRTLWGDFPGVFAALVYVYAPYHLVDAFERGAYSELTAFVWFPLILHGSYQWMRSHKWRYFLLSVASIACLILTHNLTAFIFLPMAFLIPIITIEQKEVHRARIITGYVGIWVMGILITAFFWIPILFEGQYAQLSEFLQYNYAGDFVPARYLVLPLPANSMATQIGPVIILAIGLAFICILLRWETFPHRRLYLITLVFFMLALFMTTRFSESIWRIIPGLPYVQFPWRFLAPASFFGAILAGPLPLLFRK